MTGNSLLPNLNLALVLEALFFSMAEHHILKVKKMDFLVFPGRTESYKHDKRQYYTSISWTVTLSEPIGEVYTDLSNSQDM